MIRDADALNERANDLEAAGFNGFKFVVVALPAGPDPPFAELTVYLINSLHRDAIVADAAGNESTVLPIRGGHRIRAGAAEGQVQVTQVAAGPTADSMVLRVEPVGDYSTYTLTVEHDAIDPIFSELPFKFRPGCFTNNCAPDWDRGRAARPAPAIDYLAKDYESFRHTMVSAMMTRVPGWQVTSDADLDQVLIDLIAAAGDELSDYQDRVMTESRFATCRSRISLARHARLMDYHVHQGNQASTWLALEIDAAAGQITLPRRHLFWTGEQVQPGSDFRLPNSVFFATREPHILHPLLNTLRLYTWDDTVPTLEAGTTTADLAVDTTGLLITEAAGAQLLVDWITGNAPAVPIVRQLVIQEQLNPQTGTVNGRDVGKRQLLRLLPGAAGAALVVDPLHGRTLVRVNWRAEDQLQWDYGFTVFPDGLRVPDASTFHANLVPVHHGLPVDTVFVEPDEPLPNEFTRHFERTEDDRYGVLCRLPQGPLAYLPTPLVGEDPPVSTLVVNVDIPGGGLDPWDEVESLVHSDDSEENGDHFAVETDELLRSVLRFGNGVNGRLLPHGAEVQCEYQIGLGHEGNVGADSILNPDFIPALDQGTITECWNPFDVVDGRDPEPAARVLRNAPEAYRARQLRAITLDDYAKRAREVEGVAEAVAHYAWTGSWRTVRIAIDPAGTELLADDLRLAVAQHLESVRLIGEDLELRAPRFVPLAIEVSVCLSADVWPEDIRFVLEQEFSDSYTPDGRRGFFHPDNWTFGQRLRKSEIAGRLQQVPGVEHPLAIVWHRFNAPTPGMYDAGSSGPDEIFVGYDEIIQVHNDPDQMELGYIRFTLGGGRQ
jgi:Baseplate J-like protein